MRYGFRVLAFVALGLVLFAVQAAPQAGNAGSIEGMVKDQSGAVVPNATIEIGNPVSGYSRTTTSGSDGAFRFAKGLAIGLALASLLFLLQVTPHGHANGQDEAACRLCQAAHIGVTPALAAVTLSVPLTEFGVVFLQTTKTAPETAASNSPSRAPPSIAH